MTTPARITRPDSVRDLTVTVSGPTAHDGADTLDLYACEPRLWTITSNHPLSQLPDIAIGDEGTWHTSTKIDDHTYSLLLSGPQATGGIGLERGVYRTWVRVTDGQVQLVRPAGRLRVQPAPERRAGR